MESYTRTADLLNNIEVDSKQDNLLEVIKDICSDTNNRLSPKLSGKVRRIIADCDLTHYTSLHKITTDLTVLGFMQQSSAELTFDEQTELNTAIIEKIETKLTVYKSELDKIKQIVNDRKKSQDNMKELQESLDDKLNKLEEQTREKVDVMKEWLNHRLQEVTKFNSDSTDLMTCRARILEFKSKILHLQLLLKIFTETKQSIKAYSEVHKDLKETIRETKERIHNYKEIIGNFDL